MEHMGKGKQFNGADVNDTANSENMSGYIGNKSDSVNDADANNNSDNKNGGKKGVGLNNNLIPFSQLTDEEQTAIRSKGGKASGEARRRKRDMREITKAILQTDMPEDQINEILGTAKGLLGCDNSVAAVLVVRMVQEAASGSVKALELLRDTAGWKPKDQIEVDATMTEADRQLMDKVAKRIGAKD